MKYICSDRGSATILMALIAGVIVTVGLGFSWLVKEHLKASDGIKNKTEAILKARSAFDTVVYQILNGRLAQKEVVFLGGRELLEANVLPLNSLKVAIGDDVYIEAQDSNGLLSLATINETAMRRLIRQAGSAGERADPVDAVLDWIDTDDLSRANGAEAFFYRSEGLPCKARNYAFQYKKEVEMVKGIDRKLYDKIESFLTMMPATGFNPNTAPDAVLKAILDIDDDAVKALRNYMTVKTISTDTELFPLVGRRLVTEEGVYYYPSTYMDIRISVGEPRSFYVIRAGLRIIPNIITPYSVMYWIEE